jgi:hypothetical protein
MWHTPSIFTRTLALAMAVLLSNASVGGEAAADSAITTYGVVNPQAPSELSTFAFLVGKWTATAQFRDAEGKYQESKLEWIGRYVLNGMAIADEGRSEAPGGGITVYGISFRYFDANTKVWTVEFLNFNQSFLRKQVNATTGSVTKEGNRVTVAQVGPEGTGREVYTLIDADHFTYSLDMSPDGGQSWNEGVVKMDMTREEKP